MTIFQFNVVDTQIIAGQFSTTETITVDWGDGGATSDYNGVDQNYSKDYGSVGNRTVTITATDESCLTKFTMTQDGANVQFNLADLPTGLTYFRCDGYNTVSGNLADLPTGLTYFRCDGYNTVSGNLADLPTGLTDFRCYGYNTVSGNLADLPTGLTYFLCDGHNTVSGNLADLHTGLTYFLCYGQNTVSGNLADLPTGLTYFRCYGYNTVSGNLADLPTGLTYFLCYGYNTISQYSGKTWTTKPAQFQLMPASGGLSTAEVDQLLIDFDNDLTWASGDAVTLTGTNAPRSATSNEAVLSITGQLATVTTSAKLQLGNLYKITATEADHFGAGLVIGDYFTSDGTETVDANNKVKQVLAPSTDGVVIVNQKGGSTENWLAKDAGFAFYQTSYDVILKKLR